LSKEIRVFENGLPALYDSLKKQGKEKEGKEIIKGFLRNTFEIDIDKKADRFLAIPGGPKPVDYEYFRLYRELNQLYVNGLFYSTVVLSGVLSERICYDILSRQEIALTGKGCLTREQIGYLFKINLKDIIELLAKWNLIKEETRIEMIKINEKRNSYVHPTKTAIVAAEKDSKEMITRISKILENEFEVRTM
jgi:hypothetical protein